MPNAGEVKSWITEKLECAHVEVQGADGVHFEAVIVSPKFRGLNIVGQHQLVFAALGARMHSEIHALSMRTLTPEEYADEDEV